MTLTCADLDVALGASRILQGVSLTIHPGLNVLVGSNGSGKTTLLRALAGFQRCSRGRVLLNGEDITAWPASVRRRGGLVYRQQDPLVTPDISPGDYLQLAFPSRSVDQVVGHAADLGFPTSLARRVVDQPLIASMTLGDRRALELLTAATSEAKAVLLDEPLANAGSDAMETFGCFFEGIASGASLLLVEHRKDFFAWLEGRAATGSFIQAGEIILGEIEISSLLRDSRLAVAYGKLL